MRLSVSQNMYAITALCKEAISLRSGRIIERGSARRVVENYLSLGAHESAEAVWPFENAPGNDLVKLHTVKVCGTDGQILYDQRCGVPITLSMEFWCLQQTKVIPSFHIYDQNGIMLFPTADLREGGWA